MLLQQTYDFGLVAQLVVFAMSAAYATPRLSGHEKVDSRWRHTVWLAAATAVVSGGLLATRFTRLPVRLQIPYHYSTVVLVVVSAGIAAVIALATVKREDIVRNSQAHFQTLAEAIPQIIWIADASGQTTYINQRWHELTGTPMSESVGTGWMETVHPDDRVPCQKRWQACMRSGETSKSSTACMTPSRGIAGISTGPCRCAMTQA